jgi:hypothetical protein
MQITSLKYSPPAYVKRLSLRTCEPAPTHPAIQFYDDCHREGMTCLNNLLLGPDCEIKTLALTVLDPANGWHTGVPARFEEMTYSPWNMSHLLRDFEDALASETESVIYYSVDGVPSFDMFTGTGLSKADLVKIMNAPECPVTEENLVIFDSVEEFAKALAVYNQ